MSTDDLLRDPHDIIGAEPVELTPYLVKAMGSSLGKRMAAERGLPWSSAQETDHQQAIADLVAAAKSRELANFNIVATRESGQKVVRSLNVARISKERTLQ
jgi:hypothetical protein